MVREAIPDIYTYDDSLKHYIRGSKCDSNTKTFIIQLMSIDHKNAKYRHNELECDPVADLDAI